VSAAEDLKQLESDIRSSLPHNPSHEAIANHVAWWLHKDGYRKPRTVTTVEELDALPFETVIRDGDECVLERWGALEESGWVTVMVSSFIPRDQIALPATVLYAPEPQP
jgi:hypothetical protein